MIKLKTLLLENKKLFAGDCRSDFCELFSDATEMAQAIDQSIPSNREDFIRAVDLRSAPKEFAYNLLNNPDWFEFGKHRNLIWAYCKKRDIHFFFV